MGQDVLTHDKIQNARGHTCEDGDDEINIDAIIKEAMQQIWDEFDEDKGGSLDRDETYKMLLMPIARLNGAQDIKDAKKMFGHVLSESDFNLVFDYVDADDSGEITKDELVDFIKMCTKVE